MHANVPFPVLVTRDAARTTILAARQQTLFTDELRSAANRAKRGAVAIVVWRC